MRRHSPTGVARAAVLPGDQIVLQRTWFATFVAYWQEYVLGLMDIRLIFGPKVEI